MASLATQPAGKVTEGRFGLASRQAPPREFGRTLVEAGLVSEAQLQEALVLQRRLHERLASVLVRQGMLTEKFAVTYLGRQLGVPGVDLSRETIELELFRLLPLAFCERHQVLPLRVEAGRLNLAMHDPLDAGLIAEIQREFGLRLRPMAALEVSLRHALEEARRAERDGRWKISPNVRRAIEASPAVGVTEDANGNVALPLVAVNQDWPALALVKGGGAAASVEAAAPAPAATVLLPGVSEGARAELERELRPLGACRILAVPDLEAALAQAAGANLVVMELSGPGASGLEACRHIRARRPDLPVLVLSDRARGWRFAADLRAAFGVAYLERPFPAGALLRQARAALGLPAVPAAGPSEAVRRSLEDGLAALRHGTPVLAEAAFRQGLDADPASAQLHYQLGQCCEKLAKPLQAIDHYQQAVRLNPELHEALAALARLYEGEGLRLQAAETWEQARQATRDPALRARIAAHAGALLARADG